MVGAQTGLFALKPRTREEIRADMAEWLAIRKRERVANGGANEHERELAAALPGPMAALLEIAVPGWIERLRLLTPAEFEARRAALTDAIGCKAGEAIASPFEGKLGKRTGGFNALAEALAVLAFQRGGVTWCGLHFEAGDSPAPPPKPTAAEIRESIGYRVSLRLAIESALRISIARAAEVTTDAR